jgi:hypothetical protein
MSDKKRKEGPKPDATALLRDIGAERAQKRRKVAPPASTATTTAAPQSPSQPKPYHSTRRFTMTLERKKWIVFDGENGNRRVTAFRPFPATLDEIRATPLYLAKAMGHQAESRMWQTAGAVPGVGLPGMLQAAGQALTNMTQAVTVTTPNSLTPEQKVFRDKAWDLGKADNDALGTYGVEASIRLRDIISCLTLGTGKVPAHLLHGVTGCAGFVSQSPTYPYT